MSNKVERDDKFWEMTDQFIKQANDFCDTNKNAQVGTALLFSAARFNTFMFASTTKDVNELLKDRDLAIEYFTQQYKEALTENLNDYEKNYKDYVKKSN